MTGRGVVQVASKDELRSQANMKGKTVIHAVKIIKHNHLINELRQIQHSLQTVPMSDDRQYWIDTIISFKEGVKLSGSAVSKDLKKAIVEYVELCVKYHEAK